MSPSSEASQSGIGVRPKWGRSRATAILFALEAGLDFEQGGEVARTLSRLYRCARQTVIEASIGRDPKPFLEVAANLEEIARAWQSVRGG